MPLSPNPNTSNYWVDLQDERLWRGATPIALTPKAFAMLRFFLGHPNRLVTKSALLEAIWPGITVTESEVKHYVHELRRRLADNPAHPTFIETVHGRGYRFIGEIPVQGGPAVSGPSDVAGLEDSAPALLVPDPGVDLVGRDRQHAALVEWLQRASRGERVIGFVSGEAGIGKTALVTYFLHRASRMPGVLIGFGQCSEQSGAVEPYMPVLDALEGLCQGPGGRQMSQHLARFAPSWVQQMPAVLADLDLPQGPSPAVDGGAPERMLRELVHALERPVSEGMLVLVLEDLHWADPSTLELIAALARRRRTARLLVIGTSRPEDDHGPDRALFRLEAELAVRDQCSRLHVPALEEGAVAAYVRARLPESSAEIEHAIYRHTEGNPLFMVNMVAHMSAQGLATATPTMPALVRSAGVIGLGIPENLRGFIERRLDSLAPEDRRLLEACSVAGSRFSAGTVAAALDRNPVETEEHCDALCRHGRFLQRWAAPERSGASAPRQYEFRHALYQGILYDGVSPERRVNLHRAIGLEMERSVGPNTPDLAAELALHFEQGRDPLRAARYLKQAADIALRRCANTETIQLLTRAIESVRRLPDTPERSQQELALQVSLGAPIAATKSWAAPEVDQAYSRARSLCLNIGDAPELFPILWGIWAFNVLRARHETARELSRELIGLARRSRDGGFLVEGHVAMGLTHAWRGEFEPALRHLDKGLDGYDPLSHRAHSFEYGQDPRMICLAHKSWVLWWLGYPDQALAASREAISWAREVSHPHSLTFATVYAAILHHFRGEYATVMELTDEARRLSSEHAFGQWSVFANLFRGSALVAQGHIERGITRMERSLSAHRETGSKWGEPFFLTLLAEAYTKGTQQQKRKGPPLLDQALASIDTTEERYYEAEVYRVRGEYWAIDGRYGEADKCFRRAFHIASRQNARSWQLRAATSLANFLSKDDHNDDTRKQLAPVCHWFTEGFATEDLKKARALLDDLA